MEHTSWDTLAAWLDEKHGDTGDLWHRARICHWNEQQWETTSYHRPLSCICRRCERQAWH